MTSTILTFDADRAAPSDVTVSDLVHRRRWMTLAVLCLSLLVVVVDNTIVNVALPTLARDLSAGTSSLQWIVDAYALVFAGLLLTGGSLGDRRGRKGALTAGLVIFAAAAGGGGAGTSLGRAGDLRGGVGGGGAGHDFGSADRRPRRHGARAGAGHAGIVVDPDERVRR